jgi:hypothetical protein
VVWLRGVGWCGCTTQRKEQNGTEPSRRVDRPVK